MNAPDASVGRVTVHHRTERSHFLRQISSISKRFELVSMGAARDRLRGAAPVGAQRRFAVVTFDDGCRDFLDVMDDLARLGVPACLYITKVCVDQPGYLREAEVRSISEAFEIGSHTLSHPRLLHLDEPELVHELRDSRHYLEDLIGKPVVHFAAPFGAASSFDMSTVRFAAEAGYATFRTTFRGWNTPRSTDYSGIRVLRADVLEDAYPSWRTRLALAGVLDSRATRRFSAAVAP